MFYFPELVDYGVGIAITEEFFFSNTLLWKKKEKKKEKKNLDTASSEGMAWKRSFQIITGEWYKNLRQ